MKSNTLGDTHVTPYPKASPSAVVNAYGASQYRSNHQESEPPTGSRPRHHRKGERSYLHTIIQQSEV
jgi:hypothetical protein